MASAAGSKDHPHGAKERALAKARVNEAIGSNLHAPSPESDEGVADGERVDELGLGAQKASMSKGRAGSGGSIGSLLRKISFGKSFATSPTSRTPLPRSRLVRPALLGFVAIVAISIGASQPSSPFALKLPGAWFFGVPAPGEHPGQKGLFLGLVLVYGGLLLLMRVWWELIQLTWHHEVEIRDLAWIFALWVLPLLFAPPIFSRDIYSYAAQGEMMSRGISPYHYGPSVLGAGPYVTPVDPLWLNTPAPYGPLFLWVAGMIAKVTFHKELATVVGLRLLALGGVILMAIAVPKIARIYNVNAGAAFALAILSPLTVLNLVGGAHNDAIMLGLLLLGIVAAKRGHPIWGIVICTAAAAIKVPAALGVVYVAWDFKGPGIPVKERLKPMVLCGVLSVALMSGFSLMAGLGWGWVANLATPGTVRSWLAPATALGLGLGAMFHAVGLHVATHEVLSGTRVTGLLAAAVIGLVLLFKSDEVGDLKAMGLTLLIFVVLAPVVQPWYLSWGLVTLAFVATGWLRSLIVWLSMGSCFIGLPGARQLLDRLIHANPALAILSLAALLAVLTAPLTTSSRGAASEGPESPDEISRKHLATA